MQFFDEGAIFQKFPISLTLLLFIYPWLSLDDKIFLFQNTVTDCAYSEFFMLLSSSYFDNSVLIKAK